MTDTQNKMLFDHLMTGCPVTGLDALRWFGISSLPRRILDLTEQGLKIDREWVNVKTKFGKKRVLKYFIKNKVK